MMQLFEMWNFKDQVANTKNAYRTLLVSSHPTEAQKKHGDFWGAQFSEDIFLSILKKCEQLAVAHDRMTIVYE